MPPSLNLKLLGGAVVEGPDGPVTGRATQRHRLALLAFLAATPRGATRDRIVALLWPQRETARARHALSDSIYRINKSLGTEVVVAAGDRDLRLDVRALPSDLADFRGAIERRDWKMAIDHYGGPLLDGFHLPKSVEFEEWMESARRQLARMYADALETLAVERAEAGDAKGAGAAWRRRQALDPYDTRVAMRLMEALEADGNPAAALRLARAHSELLARELSTHPGPDLVTLTERIRRGRPGNGRESEAPGLGPGEASTELWNGDGTAARIGGPAGAEVGGWDGSKRRYPGARPLHEDSTTLLEGTARRRGLRRSLTARFGWAAVATAGIGIGAELLQPRQEHADAVSSAPTLAVLPFTVSGADIETWGEDIMTLLSTGLDGAGDLRTVDSRAILAQWDRLTEEAPLVELDSALGVARRMGARYALAGSAVAIGPALRLTAIVYRVDGMERLGQVAVEGPQEQVLELLDRLGIDALRILLGSAEDDSPPIELAGVTTSSLAALKAFLEASHAYRRSDFAAAIAAYERAVAQDSTFALAYYHMIDARGWLGLSADDFLQRAVRFRDRLPAKERLLLDVMVAHSSNQSGKALQMSRWATTRYPDAAAAWYRLGETYYHNPETLTSLDEAEEMFRRAEALEPGFAPYRIHLVDLAFQNHPDSSRVADELRRYVALVPEKNGDRHRRRFELGFALAFGDPETRSDALVAIDTADLELLRGTMEFALNHARFHDVRRALLRKWTERAERRPLPAWASRQASGQLFQRGKLRAYLDDIDGGLISASSATCDLLLARNMGVAVPADRLEQMLATTRTDTTTGSALWCRAMRASELGRWEDNARAITLFRNAAQRARQENSTRSSTSTSTMEWALETLEAYAAWRREPGLVALQRLEKARLSGGLSGAALANLLFLTGELLLEHDRPSEAVPYFRAVRDPHPGRPWNALAAYHLGRAYEKLGAVEEAREAYSSFASAWKDADPELQTLVRRAREASERLRGLHAD